MRRTFAVASSLLFALAPLAAQARKPLLGTVVDAAGKPVAGAVVQLTVPGRDGAPPLDALDATTDERGRFRAQALPCTRYEAWAAGPADGDGVQMVSEVTALAVGQPASLAVRWKGGAGSIDVEDLDAWQARAPFTLRTTIAGRATDVPVAAKDGGHAAPLAARPRDGADAAVFDRDGRFVYGNRVAARANVRLRVPPPFEAALKVVDENGQPIAGARIVQLPRGDGMRIGPTTTTALQLKSSPEPTAGPVELGVTGADGVLKALFASRGTPLKGDRPFGGDLRLCALASGRAPSYGGADYSDIYEDGKAVDGKEREALKFTLRPAAPLRVRVVDGPRQVAGVAVTLRGSADIASGQGWSREWEDVRRALTDADGRVALPSPPPFGDRTSFRLELDGPLPLGDGQLPFPARPVLLAPIPRDPAAKDTEVVVDLATFATVTFAVRDESGGPGRGAQIAVLPVGGPDVENAVVMSPDAAGRLAVRLAPGEWIAVACTQDGFVMTSFVAGQAAEVALPIAPFPRMRARLVDGAGKPVVGARFVVTETRYSSSVGGGVGEQAMQELHSQFAQSWSNSLLLRAKSDEAGVLQTPFLPSDRVELRGCFTAGKQSSEFHTAIAEDLGDVVVK